MNGYLGFTRVGTVDGNKDYEDIGEHVNITNGDDIQLKDLFEIVKEVTGFAGKLEYDTSKPNGTPRKMMDATRIKSLGWTPQIPLNKVLTTFINGIAHD